MRWGSHVLSLLTALLYVQQLVDANQNVKSLGSLKEQRKSVPQAEFIDGSILVARGTSGRSPSPKPQKPSSNPTTQEKKTSPTSQLNVLPQADKSRQKDGPSKTLTISHLIPLRGLPRQNSDSALSRPPSSASIASDPSVRKQPRRYEGVSHQSSWRSEEDLKFALQSSDPNVKKRARNVISARNRRARMSDAKKEEERAKARARDYQRKQNETPVEKEQRLAKKRTLAKDRKQPGKPDTGQPSKYDALSGLEPQPKRSKSNTLSLAQGRNRRQSTGGVNYHELSSDSSKAGTQSPRPGRISAFGQVSPGLSHDLALANMPGLSGLERQPSWEDPISWPQAPRSNKIDYLGSRSPVLRLPEPPRRTNIDSLGRISPVLRLPEPLRRDNIDYPGRLSPVLRLPSPPPTMNDFPRYSGHSFTPQPGANSLPGLGDLRKFPTQQYASGFSRIPRQTTPASQQNLYNMQGFSQTQPSSRFSRTPFPSEALYPPNPSNMPGGLQGQPASRFSSMSFPPEAFSPPSLNSIPATQQYHSFSGFPERGIIPSMPSIPSPASFANMNSSPRYFRPTSKTERPTKQAIPNPSLNLSDKMASPHVLDASSAPISKPVPSASLNRMPTIPAPISKPNLPAKPAKRVKPDPPVPPKNPPRVLTTTLIPDTVSLPTHPPQPPPVTANPYQIPTTYQKPPPVTTFPYPWNNAPVQDTTPVQVQADRIFPHKLVLAPGSQPVKLVQQSQEAQPARSETPDLDPKSFFRGFRSGDLDRTPSWETPKE